MPNSPSSLRACLAAVFALAAAVAAIPASAAPRADAPATPAVGAQLLLATNFTVHNRLQATLYGFRIRTGFGRWALIGDLPPGDSQFTIDAPAGADPGTFEFRRERSAQPADYVIGAYVRDADHPVVIDLSAQPAAVDGHPVHSEQGSFLLARGVPGATAATLLARDQRLPLMVVSAELAGDSEFMICAGIGPGLSFIACRSGVLDFYSMGFGLNLGVAAGYFWSPLSPEDLSAQFPVTFYTLQPVVGAYFKFLGKRTPESEDELQKIGQFVGVGPTVGAALSWGSFSWSGWLPRGSASPRGPAGSYRGSCDDVTYDRDSREVSAQCRTSTGARVQSMLNITACYGGDVTNDEGTLRCEMPAGTYSGSCGPIRYRDGVLQALCTRGDGRTQVRSRLDFAGDCEPESSVSNVDGTLRCDRPWIPAGPYRGSCRNIRYADGLLQADCGGVDTLAQGLRLAYVRACKPRSEVGFSPRYARPGQLYCVDPR